MLVTRYFTRIKCNFRFHNYETCSYTWIIPQQFIWTDGYLLAMAAVLRDMYVVNIFPCQHFAVWSTHVRINNAYTSISPVRVVDSNSNHLFASNRGTKRRSMCVASLLLLTSMCGRVASDEVPSISTRFRGSQMEIASQLEGGGLRRCVYVCNTTFDC